MDNEHGATLSTAETGELQANVAEEGLAKWVGWAYARRVRKALAVGPLVLSLLALLIAGSALYEARQPSATPSAGDIQAEGVRQFIGAGNQMTPTEVLQLLGKPTQVFRNNPRALCWRYDAPYEIRMCWGPKRKQAWISTNIPFEPAT